MILLAFVNVSTLGISPKKAKEILIDVKLVTTDNESTNCSKLNLICLMLPTLYLLVKIAFHIRLQYTAAGMVVLVDSSNKT